MSILKRPLRLPCGAVLSNRVAKAAISEGLADPMNRATGRHITLYSRWAQGGAGLLVTGNILVDRTHLERPGNIAVDDNDGLDALRAMAAAGTSAGNHLWMQINHPGRQTPASINPAPLAPSAVALNAPEVGCGNPREMTSCQIEDVIRRFAHTARVARECGFTGVQVHSAHGYLLSQFLSPLSNQRRDEWGGSLPNRARLLLEIVRAVRKAVGNDFPVAVKLNSADFQKGGFSSDESMQVVKWLGEERIDLLEISGGNYEQMQMVGLVGSEFIADQVKTGCPTAESARRREAYFLDYARQVRPLATMPLMITGGFRTRAGMEDALTAGEVEVVGLARPFCADPTACKGLLSGESAAVPALERKMILDRAALGPVDDAIFHKMESWGQVAWFCLQVARISDGKDADMKMSLLEALTQYEASEEAAVKALVRQGATAKVIGS